MRGLQKKLYLFTYDKPEVNRKELQMRRSFDELQKFLAPRSDNRNKGK